MRHVEDHLRHRYDKELPDGTLDCSWEPPILLVGKKEAEISFQDVSTPSGSTSPSPQSRNGKVCRFS